MRQIAATDMSPREVFTIEGLQDAMLLFVDDMQGQVTTAAALQEMASAIEAAGDEVALEFCPAKTKVMVRGRDAEAVRRGKAELETLQHAEGNGVKFC